MQKVEASARAKLADLRTALAGDREGSREVFKAIFPDGLTFFPAAQKQKRRVFEVVGTAKLAAFTFKDDPTGT